MREHGISEAKRRLMHYLKVEGPCTVGRIAKALGMTGAAIRQHLAALEAGERVASEPIPPKGRGRPSSVWSVTENAAAMFPDRHGELTVGLIEAVREAFGADGLEKVVKSRAAEQIREYRKMLPSANESLKKRVEALARRRSAEGYMAEAVREKPGVYLLIEHHCPICDAAEACIGLCSAELDVFQRAMGPDVEIERTSHLLSGGDRCVYRIRSRK